MLLAPAVLLLAWSPASPLDRPLTLEAKAATISNLLPTISKATGVPLYDSPQTRDDVVLIKVRDVTLEALMARIALAVNGSWQKEGEGYRLVRSQAQQSGEAQDDRIYTLSQVKLAIQQANERLAKAKPWTQESAEALATRMASVIKTFNPDNRNTSFYSQFERLGQDTPSRRAVDRMVTSLDPVELASIPPQIRVMYSTSPTPSQRRLNSKTLSVLDQFLRENAIWTNAKVAKGVKPIERNGTTYYFSGMDMPEAQGAGKPTRALLAVSRYSSELTFQIELIFADDAGKIVSRASSNLSVTQPTPPKEEPAKEGEPMIAPSAEDLEMMKAWRGPEAQAVVSPGLREQLLQPEIIEPLAFVNSSVFFQLADAKKKNVVASLADRNAFTTISGEKPIAASVLLQRLQNPQSSLKVEDHNEWLVVYPSRRYQARQNQSNRKVLGEYVRRLATGKVLSLEESARFALTLPPQSQSFLPYFLSRLILGGETNQEYYDERILKLYGTLTPEQIRAAKGSGLAFGALRDNQVTFLNQLVYAPYSQIQLQPVPGKSIDPNRWNNFYNGLEREPTECMPNGLPREGLLKLTEGTDAVAATQPRRRSGWTEGPRYMTAEEFGWQMFSQSRPDLFPWMNTEDQRLNLDELKFGTRRRLTFLFQLTDELVINQQINQNEITLTKLSPLSGLPDEFRKKVEAVVEQQKKAYENMKPGMMGPVRTTNIPPR